MKKFTLATIALAMGTVLIAAPQGSDKKGPAPTDTKAPADGKTKKVKKPKKEKKEKEKGTKLHEQQNRVQ